MSYKKSCKTLLLGLAVLSPGLVYAQTSGTAPEVSFNTPSEGEVFPVGGEILVDVSALDGNGTISSVDLFVNGAFLRTERHSLYQWGQPAHGDQDVFTSLGEGAHQLTAVATDNSGETSSVNLNFVVGETAEPSAGEVTFYEGADFEGVAWSVSEGSYDREAIEADSGIGNDAISSIAIPSGFSVTACRHSRNSRDGTCETYNSSVANLGSLDNQISGLTVVSDETPEPPVEEPPVEEPPVEEPPVEEPPVEEPPVEEPPVDETAEPSAGEVTFYEGADFEGVAWSVSEGSYDREAIEADSGIGNDAISSIAIPSGFSVTACRHSRNSRDGTCETYNSSVANLGSLDNQISGLTVVSDETPEPPVEEPPVEEPPVEEPPVEEPPVEEPPVEEPPVEEPPVEEPPVEEPPVEEPPVIEALDLALGKLNFEETCAGCHGVTGQLIGNAINPDNCQVADCSSLEALSGYIDSYMPLGNADQCTLDGEGSCAATTAAYILNGFSTEPAGSEPPPNEPPPIGPVMPVQSPLARLTNEEYVNSIRTLLNLRGDSSNINDARDSLVPEAIVKGLTNDAETQTMTQLRLSGYSTMAMAAADDFLTDVRSGDHLDDLLNCESSNAQSAKLCIEEFSNELISKAYRRPLNDGDTAIISGLYDDVVSLYEDAGIEANDIETRMAALEAIIQYIFVSPEFVLIVERGEPGNNNPTSRPLTDFEIATRMALFLAGTLPDEELLADASAGLLGDADVRLGHAERMLNSETSTSQFVTLVRNWLGVDETVAGPDEIEKVNDFLEDWFTSEGSFSDLYQSPVSVEHVSGIETTEPVGVLGLRGFVASHTISPTPSFITRGVFVVEQLLCEALPDDIPDEALESGDLTPVQVFEEHAQQACATCHQVFDNYGAAFQQFDAETSLFDPASQDFGTSFDLFDIGDVTQTVSNLGDLSFSLAASQRASGCMTELWYRHSLRRNVDAQGNDDLELQLLMDAWSASGNRSMKALLRSVVASDYLVTLYL